MSEVFIRDAAIYQKVHSALRELPPHLRDLQNPTALDLEEVEVPAGCTRNLSARAQSSFRVRALVLFFDAEVPLQVDDVLLGNLSHNGSAGAVLAQSYLPAYTLPLFDGVLSAGLDARVHLTGLDRTVKVRGFLVGEGIAAPEQEFLFNAAATETLAALVNPIHFPLGVVHVPAERQGHALLCNTFQTPVLAEGIVLAMPPSRVDDIEVLNPAEGIIAPLDHPLPARLFALGYARRVFSGEVEAGSSFGVRLRNHGERSVCVSAYLVGERRPEPERGARTGLPLYTAKER